MARIAPVVAAIVVLVVVAIVLVATALMVSDLHIGERRLHADAAMANADMRERSSYIDPRLGAQADAEKGETRQGGADVMAATRIACRFERMCRHDVLLGA